MTQPAEPVSLTDGRVLLRAWQEEDLHLIAEASVDPYIPQMTSVPVPYETAAGTAWLARQRRLSQDGKGWPWAIVDREAGGAVGAINLTARDEERLSLGYWTIERARRRGFAEAAVRLVLGWALKDLRPARIEARVELGNVPSCRLLEKMGFTREGILRSYLIAEGRRADIVMYSLLPTDPAALRLRG